MKLNTKLFFLALLLLQIILTVSDKRKSKMNKKIQRQVKVSGKIANAINGLNTSNKTNNSSISNNTTNSTNSTKSSNSTSNSSKTKLRSRLSANIYHQLNTTMVIRKNLPPKEFIKAIRNWDYKLLDKQIETIYEELKLVSDPTIRSLPIRGFINYFLNNYEACDKDGDNVLNVKEFTECMITDKYFKQLIIPNQQTASFIKYTNPSEFYQAIFWLLDEHNNNFLNFHDYMLLRLIIFSLKSCSVISPSIDMNHFSCSIERASGLKSFKKLNYRNLFIFGLEISNNESLRNLDFVSYLFITMSLRLYGKINGKRDADINLNEMKLAIDNNLLPSRYSRDIIDQYFRLIARNNQKEGIDYRTFTFFDFSLRLFTVANSTRPYYLSSNDFLKVLKKNYFPAAILQIIKKLPQIALTPASFKMQITWNISKLYKEEDYLMKFVEIKDLNSKFSDKVVARKSKLNKVFKRKMKRNSKLAPKFLKPEEANVEQTNNSKDSKSKNSNSTSNKNFNNTSNPTSNQTYNNTSNSTTNQTNTKSNSTINQTNSSKFNLTNAANNFFILFDADNDKYMTFEDFGHFMQLSYLFMKIDKTRRGLLPVARINDLFKTYNNYPKISEVNVFRAKRLRLLNQNLLLNIYEYLIVFRIDDLVKFYLRQDTTTLFEIELKNLLKLCGLGSIPDMYLTKCLRASDKKIPSYDWECALMNSLTLMSQYYEAANSYLLAKANITLVNTAFNNIDSQLTFKN